jgi:leucyl aminopeptidase
VESTPWAHLDIAGPVWGDKGATGFGVKLLVDYVMKQGEKKK